MTKKIMIERMCQESGESKTLVTKVLASFFTSLEHLINENDELSLTGYMTIRKRFKNEHLGHDPRTGNPIKINASYLLSCRFGSKLKAAANKSLVKPITKTLKTKK